MLFNIYNMYHDNMYDNMYHDNMYDNMYDYI